MKKRIYRLIPSLIQKSYFSTMDIPLSIYVHWPYCKSKCTYCAFNKYNIPKEGQNHERMKSALIQELKSALDKKDLKIQKEEILYSGNTPSSKRKVNSIYFGGGTPSLAKPETIFEVIEAVKKNAHLSENAEIALEMNPSSFETSKLKDFKQAGINRVSLGIQSLDPKQLSFMGRDHSKEEAISAMAQTVKIMDKVSVDFIWGLPGQTAQSWVKELEFILQEFNPQHLSLYQLTIERGTPLYRQVERKQVNLPSIDEMESIFEKTIDIARQNGYEQYEVSSFVKIKSGEADEKSFHNMSYWKGHDYIGIGPGAHGRVYDNDGKRFRVIRTYEPKRWMEACDRTGHGTAKVINMPKNEILDELIIFGLRMKSGLTQQEFIRHSNGMTIETYLESKNVNHLIQHGFLEFQKDENGVVLGFKATEKGFPILDRVLLEMNE